ncbi:ferrous iron transport protein B [Candidatus Poribacteria bacterium]|nr:MAG: ferrous iron transport protein B [Candidatus Poribacteria bacterium]
MIPLGFGRRAFRRVEAREADFKIALVGNPNVGKSVIFNALTGRYVTVSNYPGTTVEVSKGKAKFGDKIAEVIDTPGMYSLLPITDEERVARSILTHERPDLILHIVDAKNISRMLPLTLQLMELEVPMILVLNIMDEAERAGIRIDVEKLEAILGIPVVPTIATSGKGIRELRERIEERMGEEEWEPSKVKLNPELERAVSEVEESLEGEYDVPKRFVALMLLQDDPELGAEVRSREPNPRRVEKKVSAARASLARSPVYAITMQRQRAADSILDQVISFEEARRRRFSELLGDLMVNPWTGIPFLLLVLYLGLYKIVGGLGAGVLVDFIEGTLFERYVNPYVTRFFEAIIPWKILQDLFVHDYGIITLGVRYAVAIILPIVGVFFLVFSVMEDSGYFPRLAMLVDRVFKRIGLNGRAVIPLVLGLGCDTMATIVTRILETRREKIIATFLLALAIPCSAQYGVITALFAGKVISFAIWAGVILFVFLLAGFLASRLVPGEEPTFFMEIPPLRLPKISNVLSKTAARMEWYFVEVFPMFILASVLIWIGRVTRVFDLLVKLISYPVRAIGLPPETAQVFLYGFFRRDYGAAGLYDVQREGLLSDAQLVVAAVTLTLFVPCIAQFLVMGRERGWRTTLAVVGVVISISFIVGFTVNLALKAVGFG